MTRDAAKEQPWKNPGHHRPASSWSLRNPVTFAGSGHCQQFNTKIDNLSCQMSMSQIQQHYQARWVQLQLILYHFVATWMEPLWENRCIWDTYPPKNLGCEHNKAPATSRPLRSRFSPVKCLEIKEKKSSSTFAPTRKLLPNPRPKFHPFCLSGFQGTTIPGFTPRSAACARGSPTKTPLANCFTSTSIHETWLHGHDPKPILLYRWWLRKSLMNLKCKALTA